jgi:hypothetical protein
MRQLRQRAFDVRVAAMMSRRLRTAFWFVVAAVVVVIIAIAVANFENKKLPSRAVVASSNHSGRSGSPGTGNSGKSRTTAPAPTTTTNPSAPQTTLQSQDGSGSESLPQFTVPSSVKGWLIHYLVNCANFGQAGNFAISVKNASDQPVAVAANQLGIRGVGGSTYFNFTPGTYALSIGSECDWVVVVQTIPQ